MKRIIYLPMLCLMFISYIATAQTDSNLRKKCGENCFTTDVIKAELKENGCIDYVLKVSYTDKCTPALSHYSIAVSCGKISKVSNSEGWKLEYGYDKTTGLYGVKVDDIPNFGETKLKSFTVSFTVCQDNNKKCATKEGCCHPTVAYKAATCVYYEKLNDSCPVPPADLRANIQKTDVTCPGADDGLISVLIEEGVEPYTYSWSTGATTSSLTSLEAGAYEVTIKDASGAELVLSETIEEPDPIIVTGVITNESCGNENGSIEVTVSGGTGDYTVEWSGFDESSPYLNFLSAGTYEATITDEAGCFVKKSFIVTNESTLDITASVTRPSCNQSDGSIDLTVSGGTEPYTYVWSNGATTQDIIGIRPGNYKVIISDSNGCSAESMFNIQENNTLKLTSIITQTSCLDDGSGAIDLIVSGGTEPYSYSWSSGQATEDISGLTVGSYTVTVTDAMGCTATARYFVSNKTFQVSSQVIQPACEESSSGSITLSPMGGVSPYTYEWSTGESTASISALEPGVYTVKITDASGCSRDLVYVISEPTGINASTTVSNDNCHAEGAYSINLTVTGGQGPYTYEWSNGASSEDLTGVDSGTYSVKITDASGCSTTEEVVVSGDPDSWSCLIDQPETETQCGSSDTNTLMTSILGADSYFWQVSSSDGQWVITGGASGSSILYSAGGTGSSAIFTLIVVKDGCTQTCTYEITVCKEDEAPDDTEDDEDDENSDDNDEDGSDDGNDNGDGNESDNPSEDDDNDNDNDNDSGSGSCEECFDSNIILVSDEEKCRTYEVTVSTDGTCRYDLSHWNIAIPCGSVKNYSNSRGWKMEFGQDPTTGIHGLKVDNIQNFGKSDDSFTVTFTICTDDYSCKEELSDWDPVVAYKAGRCVGYDNLTIEQSGNDDPVYTCTAYPNPFRDKLTFEWKADRDEDVSLDLLDSQGHHIKTLFRGKVYKGENYKVDCSELSGSMYIYKFSQKGKTKYGKLCKAR